MEGRQPAGRPADHAPLGALQCQTRNLKPQARNSKSETRDPKSETRNPKPDARKPKPETRNPKHKTPNPKPEPETRTPNPLLHPEPQIRITGEPFHHFADETARFSLLLNVFAKSYTLTPDPEIQVNHFIVSQTNPHAIPFMSKPRCVRKKHEHQVFTTVIFTTALVLATDFTTVFL